MRYNKNILIQILCGILVVWSPIIEGGTTFTAWTVSRIIALAIGIILLLQIVDRGKIEIHNRFPAICAVIFLFLLVYSSVRASYSFTAQQWFMNYLSYLIVFLAAWKLRDKLSPIITVFLLVAIIECALGFYDYNKAAVSRPNGTFFNPNYLAEYLVMATAVVFGRLVYSNIFMPNSKSVETKDYAKLLIYIVLSLIFIAGIIITGSRGATLALVCGIVAVGGYRWGWKIAPVIVVGVLLMLLVPNPLMDRINKLDETDIYAYSRAQMWKSTLAMIYDHPAGVGLGMYRFVSPRYAFPVDQAFARYGQVAEMAHNAWLDIASEMSPLAAILGIAFLAYLLQLSIKTIKNGSDGDIAGAAGAILAFAVHASVDSMQKTPPNCFMGAIFAGMIISSAKTTGPGFSISAPARIRILVIPLAFMLAWAIISPFIGRELLERAKSANSSGDFISAQKLLNRSIEVSPRDASLWESRGAMELAMFSSGMGNQHLEEALSSYSTAYELNPLESSPLYSISMICSSLLDRSFSNEILEKALASILLSIDNEPFNPFYRVQAGKLYLKAGKRDEALKEFKTAIDLEPNYAVALSLVGDTLVAAGKTNEARLYYKQAMAALEKPRPQPGTRYEKEMTKLNKSVLEKSLLDIDVSPDGFSGPDGSNK